MRLLLRLDDTDLETALLAAGHHVLVMPPPAGALARLGAWSGQRAATAFAPDRIVAPAGDADAERLAERLAVPLLPPPGDTGFLPDPFLPPPFRTYGDPPVIARQQAGRPEAGQADLPPDGKFLVPPDVVLLEAGTADVLPHWMAAGCAIVAPDSAAVRSYVDPGTAILHAAADNPMELARRLDAVAVGTFGAAARALFERRRAAAVEAVVALVGEIGG